MKKILSIGLLIALGNISLLSKDDWTTRTGKKLGIIKRTPQEQVTEGFKKVGRGIAAGWEEFTDNLPTDDEVVEWGAEMVGKTKRHAKKAGEFLKEKWQKIIN